MANGSETFRTWIIATANTLAVAVIVTGALTWLADRRYVTREELETHNVQMEVALRHGVRFLRTEMLRMRINELIVTQRLGHKSKIGSALLRLYKTKLKNLTP